MFKLLKPAHFILLAAIIFFAGKNSFAQSTKKQPKNLREAARKSMHSRDSLLRTLSSSDTSITTLLQSVEQYATTFNQINNGMANGLDTADASQLLPRIERRLFKIDSLANTHKSSTLRYLFVLRDNLDHIQNSLEDMQSGIDDINTKLFQNQHDLLKFAKDTLIRKIPADSALRVSYLKQLRSVKAVWRRTDSINRNNLMRVNLLQDRISIAYTRVSDGTDQIDSKIRKFADRAIEGEYGYIWQIDPQYNNFRSALNGTLILNTIQLNYFFKNETATHLTAIVFLVLIFVWIIYNRIKASRNNEHPETILDHPNYIYKRPVISSLLIAAVIIPSFYDHPPTGFLEAFFLLSIILVLLLIRNDLSKNLFNFLYKLFWLAVVYSASNLFIQLTNTDRYVILTLSAIAVIFALQFHKKVKAAPTEYLPYTGLALIVFIVMQCLSLVLNITGRFSLAKIIAITAVYNLWMLLTLYFVIQLIVQVLYLQFQTKKDDNSLMSWIDYNLLQKKFRGILSTLAVLLWLFFLMQNLNIDDFVMDYIGYILSQSRTVGGASFTFGGFAIFIAVIWLSSVFSKIVSYFYDISAQRASDMSALKKKNRTSTLLIRLAVFSVGFLLAVAASGFPLEKLTIIISAFGIGIGFGLQNIVNNLVSGIILAFEKPIQIGDVIEVDNRSGTMKEIGIRSSKLLTFDGSEVIIPNGDLISQHVVNWTLSNSNRQIEIIIGTAYGTDIDKVKGLLRDILKNRDDIMTSPGPSVFLHNLNESTVDFRIFFWAADLSNTLELKSRVLADIYNTFSREGIDIPFKQQDVRVFFPEGGPDKTKLPEKTAVKHDGDDSPGDEKVVNKNPPGQAP